MSIDEQQYGDYLSDVRVTIKSELILLGINVPTDGVYSEDSCNYDWRTKLFNTRLCFFDQLNNLILR